MSLKENLYKSHDTSCISGFVWCEHQQDNKARWELQFYSDNLVGNDSFEKNKDLVGVMICNHLSSNCPKKIHWLKWVVIGFWGHDYICMIIEWMKNCRVLSANAMLMQKQAGSDKHVALWLYSFSLLFFGGRQKYSTFSVK